MSPLSTRLTGFFNDTANMQCSFIARLIPVISFDAISYGAGLTDMRFLGFAIATGIGQLPATLLYSYLGDRVTGSIKALFWGFGLVISVSIIIGLVRQRGKA